MYSRALEHGTDNCQECGEEDGPSTAILICKEARRHAADGLTGVVDRDDGALQTRGRHRGAVHVELEGFMAEGGGDDAWLQVSASESIARRLLIDILTAVEAVDQSALGSHKGYGH